MIHSADQKPPEFIPHIDARLQTTQVEDKSHTIIINSSKKVWTGHVMTTIGRIWEIFNQVMMIKMKVLYSDTCNIGITSTINRAQHMVDFLSLEWEGGKGFLET